MNEDKKWPIVIIVLVMAVIGILGYGIYSNKSNKLDISKYNKDGIISANADNGQFADLVLGNPQAKVIVVEYGDYQCPACAHNRHIFEDLIKTYPDKVALIFRHFVLPGHPDAKAASAASLAAARQQQFWAMHDKIYDNQQQWSGKSDQRLAIFETYAKELGLNLEQFRQDFNSAEVNQKIKFDIALGKAHQVTATPSMIVNGEQVPVETWSDPAKLKSLIESKL